MKKITLALCACAFALTGLLASCSNEAPASANYIDRSNSYNNYKYAVAGTVTSSSSSSSVDTSDKKSESKYKSTSKIENGIVNVSWDTDENRESNYVEYSISGNGIVVDGSSENSATYDGKATEPGYDPSSRKSTDDEVEFNWIITDIDGTKYLAWNRYRAGTNYKGEPIYDYAKTAKLDDLAISEEEPAFDGDFGGEFSINIKLTAKDEYLTYTKENAAKATNESVTEYKLTFTPIESYEPAEAEEE